MARDDIPETDDEFRRVVAAFLEATSGDRDPWQYFQDRSGATAELYREIGRRGWLSVSWPVEECGSGRSPLFEFALWDEMAYARAARPPIASGFIARSIIEHGNQQQKAWLLPGIADGSLSFALGYSEPEAGSDLTSLRTSAYRQSDSYVVTGQKRWTSDAHHADFLWLICRTGTSESRARGLTLLVVPMSSAGVEVYPIETLDGHRLNEVHLTEVLVPAENRIGDEGDGWRIVQGALARERHLQLMPGRLRRDVEELADWARAGGFDKNAYVNTRMSMLNAWVDAVAATARTIVEQTIANQDTAVTAARQKIVGTSLIQEIARLPMEVGDARQLVVGQPFEFMWRESFLETIAGGTSEVMAGMVARRALGLGGTNAGG
jgi:alkylation response protein AidB-like acyl-CoA dehydrogenase